MGQVQHRGFAQSSRLGVSVQLRHGTDRRECVDITQYDHNGNIERTTTPIMQPRLTLVIYDPKTKNQSGALMQECKKNKTKVVMEAVDQLVKKLKDRTPAASASAR